VPLQDWTKRAAEAPVKLLAEQREVDQLQQPRLELVANLAAPWLDVELALLHVRVVALGALAWEAALPSDPASAKPKWPAGQLASRSAHRQTTTGQSRWPPADANAPRRQPDLAGRVHRVNAATAWQVPDDRRAVCRLVPAPMRGNGNV
jgi:hypothetical protein